VTDEPFPLARCLYIGKTVLGYTEKEVWRMTLRKLMLLFTEHQKYTGNYKEPETLDSLIPF
jgi:hypothetical protein